MQKNCFNFLNYEDFSFNVVENKDNFKSNLLILLKKIINIYSENHMNHINALWEQISELS